MRNMPIYYGTNKARPNVNRMYYGNNLVYTSFDGLCFTAQQANSTVSYKTTGTVDLSGIMYSFDGSNWIHWGYTVVNIPTRVTTIDENGNEIEIDTAITSTGNTITLANVGDKVYVKNTNNVLQEGISSTFQFVMSGRIAASGNLNSMINYADLYDYCFMEIFKGCSSLTTPPELPATKLAAFCYQGMFFNCISLTTAPELPATTLADACYYVMFYGCSSLTMAPKLQATTLVDYCYYGMFYGCTSLKVNQNDSTGTKIFTCPSTSGLIVAVDDMFSITSGTFIGTPTEGNTYNWY